MAASRRPQKGGAPRGSGSSLRLAGAAVNPPLGLPRRGTTHAPRAATLRGSGPRQAAPAGEGSRGAAGRGLLRGGTLSGAAPASHSERWARNSSTSVACHTRRACEISGRPREPLRDSSRQHGGGLGHEWRLGVRAAERRASVSERACGTLQFLAPIDTIVRAHEGFPIVRRTASADRGRRPGLCPFGDGRPLGSATLSRTAHSSSGLGRRPLTAVARVRIPYAP